MPPSMMIVKRIPGPFTGLFSTEYALTSGDDAATGAILARGIEVIDGIGVGDFVANFLATGLIVALAVTAGVALPEALAVGEVVAAFVDVGAGLAVAAAVAVATAVADGLGTAVSSAKTLGVQTKNENIKSRTDTFFSMTT